LIFKPKNLYKRLSQSTLVIGLASLAWLIYRSGTKPTRIVYPCQKAARSASQPPPAPLSHGMSHPSAGVGPAGSRA